MFSKYSNNFRYWNYFAPTINEAVIFISNLNSVGCKLQNESNILHESSANMKQTFDFLDCTMWIGFSSSLN